MSMKITFITGGAKSGKSSLALKKASALKGRKAYVATAEALDEEMIERIGRHRAQRGSGWDTYEEPVKIRETLGGLDGKYDVIVLDCLTLWLSNLICGDHDCQSDIDSLARFLESGAKKENSLCHVFIVSNEVGMGIVPDNDMARRFRDLAGILNQRAAEIADEVYLVTAGIPVRIK